MKDPRYYMHSLTGLWQGSIVYWIIVALTGYAEAKNSLTFLVETAAFSDVHVYLIVVSTGVMLMPIWIASSVIATSLSFLHKEKRGNRHILLANFFYLGVFLILILITWIIFYFFLDVYIGLRGWT